MISAINFSKHWFSFLPQILIFHIFMFIQLVILFTFCFLLWLIGNLEMCCFLNMDISQRSSFHYHYFFVNWYSTVVSGQGQGWERIALGRAEELPRPMVGPSAPSVGLPWLIPTAKPHLQILHGRRLSKHLSNTPTIIAAIQRTGSQITQLWELIGLDIHDFPRTTQNKEVVLFEHSSNSGNYFLWLSTDWESKTNQLSVSLWEGWGCISNSWLSFPSAHWRLSFKLAFTGEQISQAIVT